MDKSENNIEVLLLMALLGSTRATLYLESDYVQHSGQYWVRLSRNYATWTEANMTCSLEGRKLASLDGGMFSNLFETVAKNYPKGILTDWRADPNKDYFSWQNNGTWKQLASRFKSVSWKKRLPKTSRRCLVALPRGNVRDSVCDKEELPFMCARWGEEYRPGNTACNSFDKLYTLAATGSCYRLYGVALEWQRAAQACWSDGGHLCVVNSYQEAAVVTKMLKDRKFKTAFMGIYYYEMSKRGEWRTFDGKTLSSAGFTSMTWYSGAPHNCGGWALSNKYTPLDCRRRQNFVCEKNPKVPL